jgi:hypothetical protein
MRPARILPASNRLRSESVDTRARAGHTLDTDDLSGRGRVLELADLTLADYLRYLARYGGVVQEDEGLLLFAGAHRQPNPYRNGALRLDAMLSTDALLRRANSFFSARRSGYALWARQHGDADLEAGATAAGLRELERLPELVLDELPPYLPPPAGVEIRRVLDSGAADDYLSLVADAWGMGSMPRDVAARVFFDPESLNLPNVAAYVAYFEDRPLSAAMTFVTREVALGCQAATIRRAGKGQRLPRPGPSGERRGLAESCLWAALQLSFEKLGARLSLCQTSTLGAPVWHALGYRPFTSYARYHVPVSRPSAERAGA